VPSEGKKTILQEKMLTLGGKRQERGKKKPKKTERKKFVPWPKKESDREKNDAGERIGLTREKKKPESSPADPRVGVKPKKPNNRKECHCRKGIQMGKSKAWKGFYKTFSPMNGTEKREMEW